MGPMWAVVAVLPWLTASQESHECHETNTACFANFDLNERGQASSFIERGCSADCKAPQSAESAPTLQQSIKNAMGCGRYKSTSQCFPNCNLCLIEFWKLSTSPNPKLTTMDDLFSNVEAGSIIQYAWPDLSRWDTSAVTSMQRTFSGSNVGFTSNITNWDVSKVVAFDGCFSAVNSNTADPTNMDDPPAENKFPDISGWDVSSATSISNMFSSSDLSSGVDIDGWNVSQVTAMDGTFANLAHLDSNFDIGSWTVSELRSAKAMFLWASDFDADISAWNVGKLVNANMMFKGAELFNKPLNGWNTENVEDMAEIFHMAWHFDQDLHSWNTAKVTSLQHAFGGDVQNKKPVNFNGDVSSWNVSQVTDFSYCFSYGPFDGDLEHWLPSAGVNFNYMFAGNTNFNTNGGGALAWPMDNAQSTEHMFHGATGFNSDISSWNVAGVTSATSMFQEATAFAGVALDASGNVEFTIGTWNTSSNAGFGFMFYDASSLEADLSHWLTPSAEAMDSMFALSAPAPPAPPAPAFATDLNGWDVRNLHSFGSILEKQMNFAGSLDCWGTQLHSDVIENSPDYATATGISNNLPCWDDAAPSPCTEADLNSCAYSTTTTITTLPPPCPAGQERNSATGECENCPPGLFKHASNNNDACVEKTHCPAGTVTLPLETHDIATQFDKMCGRIDECPDNQYRVNYTNGNNMSGVWIISCDMYPISNEECPTGDDMRIIVGDSGNIQFPEGIDPAHHPFFNETTNAIINLVHMCVNRTMCLESRNEYEIQPGSTTADRTCDRCPALAPGTEQTSADSLLNLYHLAESPSLKTCMADRDGNFGNEGEFYECTGVAHDNAPYCCRNQYDQSTTHYDPEGIIGEPAPLQWAGLTTNQWCPDGLATALVTPTVSTPTSTPTTTPEEKLSTTEATTEPPDDDVPVKISAVGKPTREERAVGYTTLGAAVILVLLGVVLAVRAGGTLKKPRGYMKIN